MSDPFKPTTNLSKRKQLLQPPPNLLTQTKKEKKKSLPEDMSSSAIPKPTHRSIPSFQSSKIHRNPNFTTNFTTTKSIQNTISENPKYSHHHHRQPLLPPRPKDFRDHLKAPLQTNTNFAETPTNKKSHHHQIKSIKTSEPTVAENHQHPNTQPQTSAADPRSCQAHNTLHAAVTPPYHLIRG